MIEFGTVLSIGLEDGEELLDADFNVVSVEDETHEGPDDD